MMPGRWGGPSTADPLVAVEMLTMVQQAVLRLLKGLYPVLEGHAAGQ
jgi:hypothetical protein